MTRDEGVVLPPDLLSGALWTQKLQSIGLLTAGIAHDFNNLLAGALNTLDLLLEDAAAPLATREELQTIHSALDRGVEIVRELMVYAGEPAAGFDLVDLGAICEQMIELLHVSISKRARLDLDFGRDLPKVLANPAQIRQLIMNLIINASEALQTHDGVVFLSLTAGRSYENVRLAVRDTGCGMPDEVRKRIFEPLFSTKAAGRGLGLSIVRKIVDAHGGSVHVITSPGHGSTFEIVLPSASSRASHASSAQSAALGETDRSTVLIIEDESSLRGAVARLLTRRGFTVIQAADGSVGIDLFRAHQREIQTVLLDVTLPGVSSHEVLQRLRSARPNVKVILTSAYEYETVAASLQDQRPWEFVKKPYRLDELVRLLGTVSN